MRFFQTIFSVVLIIILLPSTVYAGGGWPQKKGKGFFKFGQSFIIANKYFDGNGNVVDITTLSLYTTSVYGEFGITDRISAVAYVPFFVRSTLKELKRNQTVITIP